jgi:hypothetical protein
MPEFPRSLQIRGPQLIYAPQTFLQRYSLIEGKKYNFPWKGAPLDETDIVKIGVKFSGSAHFIKHNTIISLKMPFSSLIL